MTGLDHTTIIHHQKDELENDNKKHQADSETLPDQRNEFNLYITFFMLLKPPL